MRSRNGERTTVQEYWLEEIYIEKTRHLEDIRLRFETNLTCISGENGTGKSTILALIACMHSRKSEGHRDNEYFFFKDGEYFTMSTFMKKTVYDEFGSDWKVHYTVLTHSEEGEMGEDGKRRFTRSTRYDPSYGWRFENKRRFRRPLFYWRWKDNIPALENPSIAKRLANFDLTQDSDYITRLQESLRYVFDDHTIEIDSFSETDSNPFRTVFKWSDHSTYNTASGRDKAIRLLALLHRVKDESIVLIDEFETGLHPKIQVSLLNEIRKIAKAKRLQVIFTTHSRDVVSATLPEERIHLKNIGDGVEVYRSPMVDFIFSDISDTKISVFCEDEVAAIWLEEMVKITGRRRLLSNVRFVPIGSCSEVLNHCKATFRNEGHFIAVLDGDKKVDGEVENTIGKDKFYQKIDPAEKDRLKDLFRENLLYLPGDTAPETLFKDRLVRSRSVQMEFAKVFDIDESTVSRIVDMLNRLDDHHKIFESIASELNDSEKEVTKQAIRCLLKSDEGLYRYCGEEIVEKLENVLREGGRNER